MIQYEVKYRYKKGKSLILSVTTSRGKKKKTHWTENKNFWVLYSTVQQLDMNFVFSVCLK